MNPKKDKYSEECRCHLELNTSDELVEEVLNQVDAEYQIWLRPILTSLIEKVKEEENEVSSLVGENGKLFSKIVAKAFEAPFPEVAIQYAIQRVHERAKEIGKQEGRMEALDEVEKSVSASKIAYEGNKKPLHKGTEDLVEYIVGLSKKTFLRTIADLKKK